MKKQYKVYSEGFNQVLKGKGFIPIIDEESKKDGTCHDENKGDYWIYESEWEVIGKMWREYESQKEEEREEREWVKFSDVRRYCSEFSKFW